ncbi:DUF5677 domain-containing protein [Rathayibacter tritici]|uniref:Uncharacterized protein n=1 Tax=Rathayibacter tritici TaxID=33888 RepID=A0A160KQG8_9MICO|nr:DUF5677 domain-containing protein [Rathayibacter tritici]AND15248.1 hypothetical protein A6122_0079 [Rathayibacter tritici]PPI40996.1 hypothetical protein C5D18_15050 [Rathayibacter tritici]
MSSGRNQRRRNDARRRQWLESTSSTDALRRLCAIWEERNADPITAYSTEFDVHVVVALRALVAHGVDCGRAIATLYEAGQPLAAVPVIRTLMEDAMTGAWLLKTPDGWKGFLREGADTRRKLLGNIRVAKPGLREDLVGAELQRAKELLDQYDTFKDEKDFFQRARSVTGSEDLYLLFRMASGVSHAGVRIVDLYTKEDPTSSSGVGWLEKANYEQADMWMRIASALLVRALVAWNHVLAGNPLEPALAPLAKRLGEAPALTFGPLFQTASEPTSS